MGWDGDGMKGALLSALFTHFFVPLFLKHRSMSWPGLCPASSMWGVAEEGRRAGVVVGRRRAPHQRPLA